MFTALIAATACLTIAIFVLGLVDRRWIWLWAVLTALLVSRIFLTEGWKRPVSSDGYYYYVWLTSLWFDHDLDLTNNYAASGNPYRAGTTRTGYADNIFPIGSAVLWTPFFAGTQAVRLMIGHDGKASPGMSLCEQRGAVAGTLILGMLGLVVLYKVCSSYASGGVVVLALSCVLWGTFLCYYLAVRPSMSEGCSFFTQALFLFLVSKVRAAISWRHGLLLGISMGVSVAVRYHNIASAWLLIPLLSAVAVSSGRRAALVSSSWILAGFVLGVSPQLCVLHRLYGTPFGLGTATWYLHVSNLRVLPSVLVSADHGLIYWHPVTLLGIAGLISVVRSRSKLDRHMLVCFALFTFVNSLGVGAGSSFGARRFSGSLPLLAIGISVLIQRLFGHAARGRRVVGLSIMAPLVTWNLFLWQALGEKVRSAQPLRPGTLFSAPSGEGTSARRRAYYLGREIKVGGRTFRGWGPVEFDREVAYRRISADRASVPARASAGEGLRVRIRARALGAGPAVLEVSFGRTAVSSFRLGLEWAEYTCLLSPTDSEQSEQLSELWFRTPVSASADAAVAVSWVSWNRTLGSE